MIDELKNMIDNLKGFNSSEVFHKIIEDNTDTLLDLEKEQLATGIDRTGQKRNDTYRPFTIKEKQSKGVGLGAITDRVTFFMTGQLYQSLFVSIQGDNYDITSPLSTYDKMVERIGDENFGLDEVQRLKFAEETALPKFNDELLIKTGLTFL